MHIDHWGMKKLAFFDTPLRFEGLPLGFISLKIRTNPELVKMAPLSNSLRTVPIFLPNTIHQCKKLNLRK